MNQGFLGDAKRSMNLIRANAVFAIGNHPDGDKPLVEPKRGVLKDRSNLDRKLALCVRALALPLALLRQKRNVLAATSRANDTIRPAANRDVLKAIVSVGKVKDCLLQSFWAVGFACHSEAILL